MTLAQSLAGRTIMVAGASSGMGRAIALAAASAGASLILIGRNKDRLGQVAEDIATIAGSSRAISIAADVTDSAALARVAVGIGNVDTLVNSVGTNIARRAFDELTAESWQQMLQDNLTAAFNLTRLVLPAMRQRREGLVINIASTAARRADKSGAAYQTAKAGVVALTHAIMEEERDNGIRMTAILPGMTDTPLLERRPTPVTAAARDAALQPADIAAACLFVMQLPPRAHVAELIIQPSRA